MATVIIRPSSVTSSTGWQPSGNVIANSHDNDNSTYAQQSSTTCNALYVMADASNIKAEVYLRQREGKKIHPSR